MAEDRLPVVREMILARDEDGRERALERLLPMQQSDFEGILARDGRAARDDPAARPAAARVPARPRRAGRRARADACRARARAPRARQRARPRARTSRTRCSARAAAASALVHPEIYVMQVRAIVRGALAAARRAREQAQVEIMIPLVAYGEELRRMRTLVEETVAEELAASGELARLPDRHHDRAAARRAVRSRAGRVGRLLQLRHERPHADRDRALARRRREPRSSPSTSRTACSSKNPFQTIDQDGVGELVAIGGRARALRSSRSSSSASAASTAATRHRSRSSTGSGSTTCRARRSACRPRASQRLVPRSSTRRRRACSSRRVADDRLHPRAQAFATPRACTSARDLRFPRQRSTGCASTSRSAPRRACSISPPGPAG